MDKTDIPNVQPYAASQSTFPWRRTRSRTRVGKRSTPDFLKLAGGEPGVQPKVGPAMQVFSAYRGAVGLGCESLVSPPSG